MVNDRFHHCLRGRAPLDHVVQLARTSWTGRIFRAAAFAPALDGTCAMRLLNDMGQFVRSQIQLPGTLPGTEIDIRAMRKGIGADRPAHTLRILAGVHAHASEIGAESRFHEITHFVRQGSASPFT